MIMKTPCDLWYVVAGAKRLAKDIELMTGSRPFMVFIICWYFFSPVLIAVSKTTIYLS